MEVSHLTESLFLPLMIQREMFDEPTMVAYSRDSILNLNTWIEDDIGLCFIPDIIKIELSFDGDVNDPNKFDPSKAEIFSIVATEPPFMIGNDDAFTENQFSNMMKNIINCFSGDMIALPKELQIYDDLLRQEWSYRIRVDQRIYPCVQDGSMAFECL